MTGGEPPLGGFLDEARRFLDGVAARRDPSSDNDGVRSERVALFAGASDDEVQEAVAYQRAAFDAGYGWISGPAEFGGRGLPMAYETAFAHLEREYALPSKGPLVVSLGMVAPTVAQFGTPDTKQRWLLALRRADAIGCQLFSEPSAGSDLAVASTAAVADGAAGWRITGQKVWTSGAQYAHVGIALTRTAPGPRHRNLTVFAVDMHAPGVDVRPLRQMTGAADFNEVFLTDVPVADTDRLGAVNDGWKVTMAMLGLERSAIGGSTSGGSGLFRMSDLAQWLREIGRDDDPDVAQAYARVYCGVTAAKAMRARADAQVRNGEVPGPEMSLGKLALTTNLAALSDLVSIALGPRLIADTGTRRTFAWSEFVLGVPGMRIGGGTDEIHRNVIAERLLGLPKDSAPKA